MSPRELRHEIVSGVLRIRFGAGDGDRRVKVDCRLDLSGYGDVVGVEVLHLGRQTIGAAVVSICEAEHVSYDAEFDALYVRIAQDNAPYQRKSSGEALIDSQDRIVGLDVTVVGTH